MVGKCWGNVGEMLGKCWGNDGTLSGNGNYVRVFVCSFLKGDGFVETMLFGTSPGDLRISEG